MRNKRQLLRIISLSLAISVAVWANGGLSFSLNNTAYAVGDLTVDWGVPSGDPIFVVDDLKPGDMESRSVEVTNDGSSIRPVGVRGEKTSESGDLSTVLDFVIAENGTDVYGGTTGPKTLAEFFDESAGENGIFLANFNPSETKIYSFKVTFDPDAGNEFQDTLVVFDLIMGLSVEIPEECSGINFSGDPIFGTSGSDSLKGTSGNDLIFGFGGSDSIKGRGGDDCLVGGSGSDSLKGQDGNDVLLGGDGSDSLKGGNGDDHLIGGEGSDSLKGGNGNDVLEGNSGSDSLKGGNGNDELFGGDDSDSLKGNNGDDLLDGGSGIDSLKGGAGNDRLLGGTEGDSLKGGSGDDFLDGGDGNDGLKGGGGVDTCINGESVKTCELP